MKNILRILLFVLIGYGFTMAQTKTEIIASQLSILQQKLFLEDNQVKIIKGYFTNAISQLSVKASADKAKADIQKNILNILDTRQKAKYNIIQSDWWKDLFNDLTQ